MEEKGTGVLVETLLENFLAASHSVVSALVYDRDGLLIGKATRKAISGKGGVEDEGDEDEVYGALGSLIEPVLKKVVDYEIGSFGSGTFESEDYRLIFLEAGTRAILLAVVPYDVNVNDVMKYCYLVAEKIAAILGGTFSEYHSLTVPDFDLHININYMERAIQDGDFLRMNNQAGMSFKLIILGDHAVGKTSLVDQFVIKKFKEDYRPTLGLSITEQEFLIQGFEESRLKFLIYDLAGQRFFQRVRKQYYFGAHTAFIVFDVTRRETFDNLQFWFDDLRGELNVPVVVIGNKVDLVDDRVVSTDEGRAWAKSHACSYIETSAKKGTNVKDAFNLVGIGLFFKSIE
ncbi:MAG: GTP-binding protein [Promethearchaeota archaeon]